MPDRSSLRILSKPPSAILLSAFLLLGLSGPAAADDDERSWSRDSHSDDHHYSDGYPDGGGGDNPKNAFNVLMNYELGMHCTGFEFAYCCVLPPYNSILAQVVKTQQSEQGQGAFARLLEGDPHAGKDALGRETVLRDPALGPDNQFQKYVLRYWHDAQPRNDGRGKPQSSTLISAVEGNSLFMWNTVYDAAATDANNALVTSPDYDGASGVVVGDGVYEPIKDSYANGWMNHLYVYADLEGSNPNDTSREKDKIRLGLENLTASTPLPLVFPPDCGPAAHPMGPVTQNGDPAGNAPENNTCGGYSRGNVLTFSGDHGTIVYTQMKVLENLPITLTSPRIWEALGLPLTPFEDTIGFFADPGLVDEDSIRPYVEMRAQLHRYDPNAYGGIGEAVLAGGGPVTGLGTAPIDIPNCERCHSNPANGTVVDGSTIINSPNDDPSQYALVQAEYNFWNAYYDIDTATGDSDWYSRLKSAAISMLHGHDQEHGTSFTALYPAVACQDTSNCANGPLTAPTPGSLGDQIAAELAAFPQNTRLGHESVICQKCHADNVIAVVKAAECAEGNPSCAAGTLIRPISEAVHRNHRNTTELDEHGVPGKIVFNDSLGRDGGCQGCHPAHRSDGDMAGYPISLEGANFYAEGDNRLASGGCFVGRDVHSNPFKDTDGAETPEHLNAVGQWLKDNVSRNQSGLADSNRDFRGIWCTNCHTQLGQEIWRTEDCEDLIHGDCKVNPRGEPSLAAVAAAVGVSTEQAIAWLDPKVSGRKVNGVDVDTTHDIWRADIGDANVATIEVGPGGPVVTLDEDGDPSVNVLSFCTTEDCVADINDGDGNWAHKVNGFTDPNNTGIAVPFSAATDGRDHWLAAGEPHCADCHAAPYVEQSGNINAFAPFNYPRKASLMRYSRGHRDISCQGCHESIHGLYPVTPTIDTTTYAQAASLNSDDSHGPLKCSACHQTNGEGVHKRIDRLRYDGQPIKENFDLAVSWAHTFTEEHDPRQDFCVNCHGDESDEIRASEDEWLEHAMKGRVSRKTMDQVEELTTGGYVLGARPGENPRYTVCRGCHDDKWSDVSCGGEDGREWKRHLSEGRVAEVVWENVSRARLNGSTCGW